MSDVIDQAVAALQRHLDGRVFAGSARFDITDEGSIILDQSGARASDEDADVVLTASEETFRQLIDGRLNPMSAFMSGKLSIEGDMGAAMKLSTVLG